MPCIGFLAVVEDEQLGWIGGYLVLNTAARPLEFHCTSPVKPNRAQQILYGPTLAAYLCGEQIGQTLVKKSTLQPLAICTDSQAALAVRAFVDSPVALLMDDELLPKTRPQNHAAQTFRFDDAHDGPAAGHAGQLMEFRLAAHRLAVDGGFAGDRDEITNRLAPHAENLDLAEPFERIREAIEETQLRGR